MVKRYIATNEKGYRIGQDHPNSKLTDIEVAALIRDRGPEDAPTMSLSQLAKRYGLSKSGVKGIIDGNRRGQAQRLVKKDTETKRTSREPKVSGQFRVSLRARSILNRIGGGKALERMAWAIDARLRCAPTQEPEDVFKRVLDKIAL